MAHQFKISLEGVEPPIWRRVLIPSDLTLLDLHFVIQTAMGWENEHLHDFMIGKQRYCLPDDSSFGKTHDEMEAVLKEVAPRGKKIRYQYDFGDSWYHLIVVEKVSDDPELTIPKCLDGARACPPEDSGGVHGYEAALAALAGSDEEERERASEMLGDDFDPESFDLAAVNRELEVMYDEEPAPAAKPRLAPDEQRKARNKRKKQRAARKK